MNRRGFISNHYGFTLIEIIAVLIILGILAAVAVPKYFDLRDQAITKALQGGLAEGKARVNQYGAQQVLSLNSWPAATAYTDTNLGTDAGDFTLSYSASGSTISITAKGAGGAIGTDKTVVGTMVLPGN